MTELRKTRIDGIGSQVKNGIDSSTQSLNAISYEHHETHGGNHYFVCDFDTLTSGTSTDFGMTTANGSKWVHLVFDINGTSQTEFRIFEGATLSGGVSASPYNNNRNSDNTSTVTLSKNPVISGGTPTSGTNIYSQSKGLAGANKIAADNEGLVNREREIVLKSGTSYLFEIKAVDDNIISYCGEWYEHTDKVQKF